MQDVFTKSEWDARGGYYKEPALSFYGVSPELIRWLVEQGADIEARDQAGKTPLYKHAESWCGHTELLLELGAEAEALDHQHETPLFAATTRFHPHAVRILLASGVRVNATNTSGHTPLQKALARCSNINIVEMAQIAELLLAAGASITPDMKQAVERIGNNFEFHRASFNKDALAETDAGLMRLYELFDVTPVARRRMHDGISPITVSTATWQQQHDELWKWLVPAKGAAQTVQGEAIRVSAKILYEIMDNGGGNWDKQFRHMLKALLHYWRLGVPLRAEALEEATTLAKQLQHGDDYEAPARLCELAVEWVLANPQPLALEQPEYKR
ncbi:ankyrin repeat domain-containing protein [Paenibacillus sp. SGZ-1009]|uniref:ankyrin repeat domain-containing protein n=1 Tax=Paenibacillus campi TaxID=3106031 RepID=UPI002AFEFB91|nr:ankyrin repeat domain-containing protein [Paenibacillus sp. SGZ-1009]